MISKLEKPAGEPAAFEPVRLLDQAATPGART
jgi:hypothetical protein